MSSTTSPVPGGLRLRRPRAAGILAAAVILVGLTYGAAAIRPASVPPSAGGDRRSDPATIVAPGGSAGLASLSLEQIDRSIKAWTANLSAEPRDFLSATTLATLYHGRGQLTGGLDDHERGLQAAQTALEIAPMYAPARALDAAIRYTLHDFSGALGAAEALYRDDPSQLGALATAADAQLELGRIDDARSSYARLSAAAPGPAMDVRLARLAFVTGRPDEALRLALAARDAARAQARASGSLDLGFYEFVAGEYARLAGDASAARAGYAAALAIRATDLGALVGLARIDAFDGRTTEAITGLRAAAAIAPQPDTLAILGDLLDGTRDTAGAEASFKTVRFIEQLGSVQGAVYDRLLLSFELDHDGATTGVLAAAEASSAARPDSTGHDLVAWALYRLGRFDEAAAEIEAARAYGADDARLRFHDGAIALARGDRRSGLALLESALASGPALDPIDRAEAGRLART